MAASIKIVLFTSKTYKNGEHPIALRITKDRKSKYHFIGFSCLSGQWDLKKSEPNKKHPNKNALIALINNKKTEANKILMTLDDQKENYSSETVSTKLARNQSTITLFGFFNERITQLEQQGRIGTSNVFISTRNNLKKYLDDKDITISLINFLFIKKWEEWLNAKGNKLNSDFVHLRTFKTLLNEAKKQEIVNASFDPFKEFNFKKYRSIKTEKKAIKKDDIKKLINLNIPIDLRLYDSHKYFLFSFYSKGMNFSDMAFLKWNQLEGDIIRYNRKKTSQDFKFELISPAIAILKYFKPFTYKSPKSYVFPILNETHTTPKSIDNRIDKVLKMVNSDLKVLAEMISIEMNLTFYAARHSAASLMKHRGVSESVISESLGHTSERTTRIYLKNFEDEVLHDANKILDINSWL